MQTYDFQMMRRMALPDVADPDVRDHMAQGIYYGLDASIYHALPLPSNSKLKQLAQSPRHLWHSVNSTFDPTTASLRRGAGLDTLLLERDEWVHWTKLKPGEKFSEGLGLSKKRNHIDVYGEAHFQRHSLNAKEHRDVLGMRDSIMADPEAKSIIERGHSGMNQVSIVFWWMDMLFKGRFDRLIWTPTERIGFDLKTTVDASPDAVRRTILKYKYHIQATLYMIGAKICGKPVDGFKFLFVENEAPYCCQLYTMTDEWVQMALEELPILATKYRICVENNWFPAYGGGDIELSPEFTRRRGERPDFIREYLASVPHRYQHLIPEEYRNHLRMVEPHSPNQIAA